MVATAAATLPSSSALRAPAPPRAIPTARAVIAFDHHATRAPQSTMPAHSGTVQAYSELRRRLPELLPELRSRALRMARDASEADDVVQDTVERALRFEHQYEPDSNLRGWLARILHSVFITRCRSQRRQQRAFQTVALDPCAWMASDPTPAMCELSPNAARALGAIPESFRQAIELVDLADLSYRDAAEAIGVPLGTVMSRLHRGRKLLAQALASRTVGEAA